MDTRLAAELHRHWCISKKHCPTWGHYTKRQKSYANDSGHSPDGRERVVEDPALRFRVTLRPARLTVERGCEKVSPMTFPLQYLFATQIAGLWSRF